jgi:hypothetical protein
MINANQDPKCADLVQDNFNNTEADYKKARKFFEEYQDATEGQKIALKVIDKKRGDYFHEYEDLYDYFCNSLLCFDHVGDHGKDGYYRLQLSWGGPSDEFRVYTNEDAEVQKIEYWYMDWFDGASFEISKDSESWSLCDLYLESERSLLRW